MSATTLPARAASRPAKQPAASPRLRMPIVFNIRSKRRFAHDRLLNLAAHLGRPLSYTETILAHRIAAIEWELRRQDAQLEAGEELSGHAMRARLAAENRLRLDLQVMGMKPQPRPKKTLAEYLSE